MKLKIKKIFSIAGFVLCMAMLPAFMSNIQASSSETQMSSEEKESYISTVSTMLTDFGEYTQEQIDEYKAAGYDMTVVEDFRTMTDDIGAFQEITSSTVELDSEGNIIITATLAGADGEGKTVFTVDSTEGTFTATFEVQQSKATLLKEAGLNTLIGLATVFLVLIFLSFLISLLKYIPRLLGQEKHTNNGAVITSAGAAPKSESELVFTPVQEELVDDMELAAVISAAIAASENTSTDTFVVRSIKRVNHSKRHYA